MWRLVEKTYFHLYSDLAARYRDAELARFNAAILVGGINSVYATCTFFGALAILGVPPASIKGYAGILTTGIFGVGLVLHYFFLATKEQHSKIDAGFDRTRLGKRLPTVLFLIWWIGAPCALLLSRALFAKI